jgi:hypothetical protein
MPPDFLQGELNARLQSARTRLVTIKSQAETEHLRYNQLEEIADEIADLEAVVLGDPNLSYAAVARKVTPLQRIFSNLDDVQNALRFHRNLDASVNQLRRDLSDKQLIIRIGKELGLDTTRTEQAESKMAEGLKVFQPGSSDSPENTVNAFRTARDFLSELNTAANALGETIGVQWYVRRTQDAAIETYIPKRCSTKEPVTGLVVFHPRGQPDSTRITFNGTLLDLQSETTIELVSTNRQPAMRTFEFAGKRGGRASLRLSIAGDPDPQMFRINVTSSLADIARDSVVYSVPVGAIVLLVLWRMGWKLSDSGTIASAAGGAFALLVFAYHTFRSRF